MHSYAPLKARATTATDERTNKTKFKQRETAVSNQFYLG